MILRNKNSYSARWVNRLSRFKWFRRSCGGHWLLVTKANCPKLRNLSYWVQYKRHKEVPTSVDKLIKEFGFNNVYEDEYWGDAYTYVGYVLEKKD